ncbi:MAG: hypothetical protein AABY18_02340 [Candidatus Thermoplasmatota archaeon]
MRAVAVLGLLLVALLAGCSAKGKTVYDTPALGRDAAYDAALAHDATAKLVALIGAEPTTDNTDNGFIGLEKDVFAQADPRVGDGKARVWLWTFRYEDGSGWQVLTSGIKVVKQEPAEPEVMADLTDADVIVGNSRALFLDTANMAEQLDEAHPGWHDVDPRGAGLFWAVAGGGIPHWAVFVAAKVGEPERVYEFDSFHGRLLDDGIDAVADLALSDCTNFGGVFPVPMADATAALPAGFQPVPSASDPTGGATLYILALDCTGSRVDGNDTGPTNLMYAELAVVPPDEFKLPGITDYTVPLAFGATSDAVGDRLAQFMLGHAGRSTVSDISDLRPGPWQARMVVDGVTLDLAGQVAPGAGTPLSDGAFALIGVQDGAVRSIVQATSQGGTAVQGPVAQQSSGLPIFAQARPAAVGFSVSGFTLDFALAKTF